MRKRGILVVGLLFIMILGVGVVSAACSVGDAYLGADWSVSGDTLTFDAYMYLNDLNSACNWHQKWTWLTKKIYFYGTATVSYLDSNCDLQKNQGSITPAIIGKNDYISGGRSHIYLEVNSPGVTNENIVGIEFDGRFIDDDANRADGWSDSIENPEDIDTLCKNPSNVPGNCPGPCIFPTKNTGIKSCADLVKECESVYFYDISLDSAELKSVGCYELLNLDYTYGVVCSNEARKAVNYHGDCQGCVDLGYWYCKGSETCYDFEVNQQGTCVERVSSYAPDVSKSCSPSPSDYSNCGSCNNAGFVWCTGTDDGVDLCTKDDAECEGDFDGEEVDSCPSSSFSSDCGSCIADTNKKWCPDAVGSSTGTCEDRSSPVPCLIASTSVVDDGSRSCPSSPLSNRQADSVSPGEDNIPGFDDGPTLTCSDDRDLCEDCNDCTGEGYVWCTDTADGVNWCAKNDDYCMDGNGGGDGDPIDSCPGNDPISTSTNTGSSASTCTISNDYIDNLDVGSGEISFNINVDFRNMDDDCNWDDDAYGQFKDIYVHYTPTIIYMDKENCVVKRKTLDPKNIHIQNRDLDGSNIDATYSDSQIIYDSGFNPSNFDDLDSLCTIIPPTCGGDCDYIIQIGESGDEVCQNNNEHCNQVFEYNIYGKSWMLDAVECSKAVTKLAGSPSLFVVSCSDTSEGSDKKSAEVYTTNSEGTDSTPVATDYSGCSGCNNAGFQWCTGTSDGVDLCTKDDAECEGDFDGEEVDSCPSTLNYHGNCQGCVDSGNYYCRGTEECYDWKVSETGNCRLRVSKEDGNEYRCTSPLIDPPYSTCESCLTASTGFFWCAQQCYGSEKLSVKDTCDPTELATSYTQCATLGEIPNSVAINNCEECLEVPGYGFKWCESSQGCVQEEIWSYASCSGGSWLDSKANCPSLNDCNECNNAGFTWCTGIEGGVDLCTKDDAECEGDFDGEEVDSCPTVSSGPSRTRSTQSITTTDPADDPDVCSTSNPDKCNENGCSACINVGNYYCHLGDAWGCYALDGSTPLCEGDFYVDSSQGTCDTGQVENICKEGKDVETGFNYVYLNGNPKEHDTCKDEKTINNYYCDSENNIVNNQVPCPSGEECHNGDCVDVCALKLRTCEIGEICSLFGCNPDPDYVPLESISSTNLEEVENSGGNIDELLNNFESSLEKCSVFDRCSVEGYICDIPSNSLEGTCVINNFYSQCKETEENGIRYIVLNGDEREVKCKDGDKSFRYRGCRSYEGTEKTIDVTCPDKTICVNGNCEEKCGTIRKCPDGQTCEDGGCVPANTCVDLGDNKGVVENGRNKYSKCSFDLRFPNNLIVPICNSNTGLATGEKTVQCDVCTTKDGIGVCTSAISKKSEDYGSKGGDSATTTSTSTDTATTETTTASTSSAEKYCDFFNSECNSLEVCDIDSNKCVVNNNPSVCRDGRYTDGRSYIFKNGRKIDNPCNDYANIRFRWCNQDKSIGYDIDFIDCREYDGVCENGVCVSEENEPIVSVSDGGSSAGPGETGPVCGNGVLETGEQCDDGANVNGDGCSSNCQIESGWTCSGTTSSACTENLPAETGPECGNNIIEDGEECEVGNLNGRTCSYYDMEGTLSCSNCNYDVSSCSELQNEEPEPGYCDFFNRCSSGYVCDTGNTVCVQNEYESSCSEHVDSNGRGYIILEGSTKRNTCYSDDKLRYRGCRYYEGTQRTQDIYCSNYGYSGCDQNLNICI
jgi:cysteine-rich repeat protein